VAIHAPFSVILHNNFTQQSSVNLEFGYQLINLWTLVTITYLGVRLIIFFWNIKRQRDKKTYLKEGRAHFFKLVRSIVWIFTTITLPAVILLTLSLQIFHTASIHRTIEMGNFFMSMDHNIFGVYLPFWLHKFSNGGSFEYSLVWSYLSLFSFIPFVLIGLFIFNRIIFRKFILSFFLVFIIGITLWSLYPALSPSGMYRYNILDTSITKNEHNEIFYYPPSPLLRHAIAKIEETYVDSSYQLLYISTNPSMHAAWAFLIAFYATEFFWPLGIFFIPWALENMLGAVWVEQHYGIDIITGIFISLVSVIFVNILIRIEGKYLQDRYDFYSFARNIHEDAIKILRKFLLILGWK
jgi:membrane-associated phospholipid phosphatase